MTEEALYFTGQDTVERRPLDLGALAPGEIEIETRVSGISPGTELLVYHGNVPEGFAVDETIDALGGEFQYPLTYGYASVGDVRAIGEGVDDSWLGRTVFSFTPHQTATQCRPESVFPLPPDLPTSAGVLLPQIETATNLVLDGNPKLGERVIVFGAGVVGLNTIRMLGSFPLERLVVVEPRSKPRELARSFGADVVLEPVEAAEELERMDMDLAYEITGNPSVLDDAIDAVGYDGRIVVASWYGTKRAAPDLGGRFHRDRIDIVSSQVSTIRPELRGRWDRERRFETAGRWLERIDHERLITDRVPFHAAGDAYERLAATPEDTLQVVLTYE